jgi:hypothetical protein
MESLEYSTILIGVIMGISEYIKYNFLPFSVKNITINAKFIPIFNIGLAFIMVHFVMPYLSITDYVIQSMIIGLSSSGLYSGIKNISQGVKNNKAVG